MLELKLVPQRRNVFEIYVKNLERIEPKKISDVCGPSALLCLNMHKMSETETQLPLINIQAHSVHEFFFCYIICTSFIIKSQFLILNIRGCTEMVTDKRLERPH